MKVITIYDTIYYISDNKYNNLFETYEKENENAHWQDENECWDKFIDGIIEKSVKGKTIDFSYNYS